MIHYDPWWNPAAQAQATDRAHRIGQTKPVFVHNLIVAGSVEERMLGAAAPQARARGRDPRPTATPRRRALTERDVDDLLAPLA